VSVRRRLGAWLDTRVGHRAALADLRAARLPGGASMMYVFGWALTFLLGLQLVTGVLLALVYSPSVSAAWASVAYLEDQTTWGWLVRGVHHYGASAVVITTGLHLMQTAVYGAYKKPREVNWLLGLVLLALVMGFALTGYLLPWDATGYAATQIATGIAGSTPLVGEPVQQALQGGNDLGNLTLTRLFTIHALLLPLLTVLALVLHIRLYKKHGPTPRWDRLPDALAKLATPVWPHQTVRVAIACAAAFAAIVTITVVTGGAGLDEPADPAAAFDARPAWYFRPLFQALKYVSGSAEVVVALGVPALVGGYLLLLPRLDRSPERAPRRRLLPLGVLGVFGLAGATLLALSYRDDAADAELGKRRARSEQRAAIARQLARTYGVPAAGGPAVFTTARFYRARALWQDQCAGCHVGDGKDRKGPVIGPGYGGRAWIAAFLKDPSGDEFFGRTKLAGDAGMPPVELTGAELDAMVELVYAQTGATDAAPAKAASKDAFAEHCEDCHTLARDMATEAAPALHGWGSRRHLESLIVDAAAPRHFGSLAEMPAFELMPDELRALADYLLWLRGATEADVAALEPVVLPVD
jgi:ubiquinol-cytochrome c reductase cytochrome b subunit